jgi:hypothetical protein
MRKFLVWLAAAVGVAALIRRIRRRAEPAEITPAPAETIGDPAEELRRKLAETRPDEQGTVTDDHAGTDVAVDEQRSDVHEKARGMIDEMKPSDEDG